eukprot:jgi/Astpho2/4889/Aster-x0653
MPAGVQPDPFEAIFSSRNASNQGPGDGIQQAGPSFSGSSAWSLPSSPRGPDILGSNLSGGSLSSGNPFARGHAAPSSTGEARTASPAGKRAYHAFQDLLPPELSSPLRVGSSPMKAALLQSSAGSRGGSSSSLASAGQGQCRGDQAAAGAPAQDPLWGGAGLGGASEQPAASSGSLPGPSVLGTAEASPLAGAAAWDPFGDAMPAAPAWAPPGASQAPGQGGQQQQPWQQPAPCHPDLLAASSPAGQTGPQLWQTQRHPASVGVDGMSPAEVVQLFEAAGLNEDQRLAGEAARRFFLRTGLQPGNLSMVWQQAKALAPAQGDGLTLDQFAVALRLVALVQTGHALTPESAAEAAAPAVWLLQNGGTPLPPPQLAMAQPEPDGPNPFQTSPGGDMPGAANGRGP